MRPRDVVGAVAGLAVVVAVVVVLEKQYDVGDAWVGIVGVIGGALVTFLTDRVRASEEADRRVAETQASQQRADIEWVRERRFAAYDDALVTTRRLTDVLLEKQETGSSPASSEAAQAEWHEAMVRVSVYGTPEALAATRTMFGSDGKRDVDDLLADLQAAHGRLTVVVGEEVDGLWRQGA